jgi:ceramide glucosyltransferase
MDYVILLAGAFCTIVALLHFSSILTVVSRLHNANAPASMRDDVGGVSILRPVCGIENFIEETLQTTFWLDYPRYEVLFCAANANDPVIPIVRSLIAKYPHIEARLLIGNTEISPNPKLNNLVKGWHAARHDWILMVDSNVLMPKDHIERMLSAWRRTTGLVCSLGTPAPMPVVRARASWGLTPKSWQNHNICVTEMPSNAVAVLL